MVQRRRPEELAISFVNTRAWRLRNPPEERLVDAAALLTWCAAAGLCAKEDARAMSPDRTAELHNHAVELREAIYSLLRGVAGAAPFDRLAAARVATAATLDGLALEFRDRRLAWRAADPIHSPEALLAPIAHSALALAAGPWADRVKQCQDERGCGWLFVDESRAGNRRWCSMGDCGNRAKAARRYARVKSRRASA